MSTGIGISFKEIALSSWWETVSVLGAQKMYICAAVGTYADLAYSIIQREWLIQFYFPIILSSIW